MWVRLECIFLMQCSSYAPKMPPMWLIVVSINQLILNFLSKQMHTAGLQQLFEAFKPVIYIA